MEYKVLDEKGVQYLDPAQKIVKLSKGSIIRQADIDNRYFSIGGLERLEKDGRVEKVLGSSKKVIKEKEEIDPLNNKKMKKERIK